MSRTSPIYYVAPSAVTITPSVNGNADDISVYVARGTRIKLYCPRLGIGTSGSSYREWSLSGRNRRLADSAVKYTIYARLAKNDADDGYLVFSPMAQYTEGDYVGEWYESHSHVTADGLSVRYDDGSWQETVDDPVYWYVRLGEVSLPEDGVRTVTLDTGVLGTELFNTEWAVNPDAMPLRLGLRCAVGGEDAGPAPYVYWGQSLVLSASLTEGWTGTDIVRFDHWGVTRDTADAVADAAWQSQERVTAFSSSGTIELFHNRGTGAVDDFGGAVSTVFTVTAWGRQEEGSSVMVPLISATVNILAETVERYELSMSSFFVSYSPQTESYSPSGGVVIRFRATDQRGTVFLLTKEMYDRFALSLAYSVEDSGTWLPLQVGTSQSLATATLPVSAFSANKNVNVRLSNAAGTELSTDTVAFIRDGEDSKVREWIFLRSATAITFGTEDHPYPSAISGGEVNPGGAATGEDTDKDQDGWVPEGWYDEMQGTDENMPYEYGAYRDYLRGSDSSSSGDPGGQWGEFTNPSIWSHYGTDGNSAPSYSFVAGIESIRVDKDGDYVDPNGRKKANIEFAINVFKTVDDVRDTSFIAAVYEVVYYSDGTSASTSYNIRTDNTHNFSKPFRPDATKHVTSIRLRFRQYNGGNVNLYIKEIVLQQDGEDGLDAAPTAPNLLLDTAEYKNPSLWFHLHGTNVDGYMGRVARFVDPQGTSDPAGDSYQRIAEQIIAGEDISLLEPNTWYTLSGYFKGGTSAFIGLLQCGNYVEGTYYADGEERTDTFTPTGDMYVSFGLTSEWKRHTLTFKTKATMSDTYNMYASSRLLDLSGNASVCMLKLEVGEQATAYIPNEQDLTGEDAVNVLCTPSALIVNQSLSDPSNLNNLSADPSARAIIQILKGVELQTITAVTITSQEHCTATAGVSGGNGYIQLASVATYTEQGNSYYYDRGYVICSLTYAGGTIDNVKLSFYANLLGTWKETVEADTKAAIAQSNLFDLDPETGQIVESQYLGNFIQSSTQNIATLQSVVGNANSGLVKSVSDLRQEADGIALSVEKVELENVNFTDKSVWELGMIDEEGDWSTSDDWSYIKTFLYGEDSGLHTKVTYPVSVIEDRSITLNGGYYVRFWWFYEGGTDAECTQWLDPQNGMVECTPYHALPTDTHHFRIPTGAETFAMEITSNTSGDDEHSVSEISTIRPSVESSMMASQGYAVIAADNVRIGVKQGLNDTGIDIDNQNVTLKADKVKFTSSDGTVDDKVSIDAATGTLVAENAKITGGVFINRVALLKEQAFTIGAGVIRGSEIVYEFFNASKGTKIGDYTVDGDTYSYYALGNMTLKSNNLFIMSEGMENRRNTPSVTFQGNSSMRIILPPPQQFIGQSIVITNQSYGFNDGTVLLEQGYECYTGTASDYITFTDKRFLPYDDDYLYKTQGWPNLLDSAPYVDNGSGTGCVVVNGIWQMQEAQGTSATYKYITVNEQVDLGEYDWLELTAVGSGTVDYTNRLPEEALEYDAVWMITRWEKKTASQS